LFAIFLTKVQMKKISIRRDSRNFLARLLDDLLCTGWKLRSVPTSGVVPRNGLLLRLITKDLDLSLRIFVYKVTTSGRSRPDERRIEITSTYSSALVRRVGFVDLVIGIEDELQKYVGVDSRRLSMGGTTHNASSFFDIEGLSVRTGDLLINPRPALASLFPAGVEYHGFFDRSRLAEYLFNQQEIHAGTYSYNGVYKGRSSYRKTSVPKSVEQSAAYGDAFVFTAGQPPLSAVAKVVDVVALENGLLTSNRRRKISPQELKKIQATCEENGLLGEQLVMERERKRLRRLGHLVAASRVKRVSLTSISEGYDISSFEDDGQTPRYLEVKSTIGTGWIVDISLGEWKAAERLGDRYYLVRVIRLKKTPEIVFFKNPFSLVADRLASKTEAGWRLDLTRRATT
jgi:hypothetical protein